MQDPMDRIDLELDRQADDEAMYYQQQQEEMAEDARRIAALDAEHQLLEWRNFLHHWFRHNAEAR